MQTLFDLEATNDELKTDLRDLYITGAREIDVPNTSRKAVIVHVSDVFIYFHSRVLENVLLLKIGVR